MKDQKLHSGRTPEKDRQSFFLLHAIGEIDDRFIEEAAPDLQRSPDQKHEAASVIHMSTRKSVWKPVGVLAAAVMLFVGVGLYLSVSDRNFGLESSTPSANATVENNTSGETSIAPASEGTPAPEKSQETDTPLAIAENKKTEMRIAQAPAEAFNENTEQDAANDQVTIANPWSDWDTLSQAEQDAGINIVIPDSFTGTDGTRYQHRIYRSIKGDLLEILYQDDTGKEGLRIRKSTSADAGEISGDYESYPHTVTEVINGNTVTLKGNHAIRIATWAQDGRSYSVSFSDSECSLSEAKVLIAGIH